MSHALSLDVPTGIEPGALTDWAPRSLGRRVQVCLAFSLYLAALWLCYSEFISPIFYYLGLPYASPPAWEMAAACLLAFVPALWLPIALVRPSQIVCWFLYFMVYVPVCIVPWFWPDGPPADYGWFCAALLTCLITLIRVGTLRVLAVPRLSLPALLFWLPLVIASLALWAPIVQTFGITFQIHSLFDVYDVRADSSRLLSHGHPWTPYAMAWQARVISPFLIGYGLQRRNLGFVALGAAGSIILFSIGGHKSELMIGVLIAALIAAIGKDGRDFGLRLIWAAAGLVALCCLLDVFLQTSAFTALFPRRLFVIPGQLTVFYYDFFSQNPKAWLGYGILRGWVDYPYDLPPAYLIGEEYLGSAEAGANACFWADGYANFGYPGIFGVTAILAIVLWIFDSISVRQGRLILPSLLLGVQALNLASTGVLTTLLTHGLGLSIALTWLLPDGKETATPADGIIAKKIAPTA